MTRVEELERVLRLVEWGAASVRVGQLYAACPACEGVKPGTTEWPDIEGHRSDCPLAAALKESTDG